MSESPVVSIIICTRDRASDLAATLTALGRTHIPDDLPTELVVVDNASADDTARVVEACRLPNMPVRYVLASRRGKGHAYNAGLAAGLGQVFLFTDDDVRPPHDWVAGMCRPILAGEADAVAGGVRFAPHLERPWLTEIHRVKMAHTNTIDPVAPGSLVGANMAFSRSVLEKVPRFDTELGPGALGFADETLFSWQLKEAGYRFKAALDVVVEHHFDPARLTYRSLLSMTQNHERSNAYVLYHWKHEDIKAIRLRLLARRGRLALTRWLKRHELAKAECPPAWEENHVGVIALMEQYLVEAKRPRNYERRGLVKRKGAES